MNKSIILFCFLLSGCGIYTYRNQLEVILANNPEMISNLIKNNPELFTDVIDNAKKETEKNKKQGLDNEQ